MKLIEEQFSYLNILDGNGNFLEESGLMIDFLRNNKMEGMMKILEKYKQKIEEEQQSCGILEVKNLRTAKKVKVNNPGNATMFYLCGKNMEDLKEMETQLGNHFDQVVEKRPETHLFSLPLLNTYYKVKVEVGGRGMSTEDLFLFPRPGAVALFKNRDSHKHTNNYNAGFIYSQVLNCQVTRPPTHPLCLAFTVSYGFSLGEDYLMCILDDKIRLLNYYTSQVQWLLTSQCLRMKGQPVPGATNVQSKQVEQSTPNHHQQDNQQQQNQDINKALEQIMDSKPIPQPTKPLSQQLQ